jgi:hypothetical protein
VDGNVRVKKMRLATPVKQLAEGKSLMWKYEKAK